MINANNNNNSYQEAFFITPSYILDLPGITLAFLKVYATIFQFWNKGLTCYLSNTTLMERTGLSSSHAREALSFFEKNGELERKTINGKRYLVQPARHIKIDNTEDEGAGGAAGGCRSAGMEGAGAPAHNIKKGNKENNNIYGDSANTPKKTSLKNSDYRKDERFMRFYAAYPRKVKPADAYKAFKQIVKDDDALLERIMEDIPKRLAANESWKEKQYVPYPASYLRSNEFDSEILDSAEEARQKNIQKEIENKKREAQQERLTQERREHELNKHKQYNHDAKMYRNICAEVAKRSKPPKEFDALKEILRR